MRSSLFEHIKETEDFPYGLQCVLKRGVCTRNSDSVAVKLVHDIHTLIAVLEGAEYLDMRELLSSGSGRSQQHNQQPMIPLLRRTILLKLKYHQTLLIH